MIKWGYSSGTVAFYTVHFNDIVDICEIDLTINLFVDDTIISVKRPTATEVIF